GRGLERLRPDACHRRLRSAPGGRVRLFGSAPYAAAFAAGADRMAAPRLQPLLRAYLPARAHQLPERYRTGPGPGVTAPRNALRDCAPASPLAARQTHAAPAPG